MSDLLQEAKKAIERPDSFAYFGELPLFETWGLCGPGQHRDSDTLGKSNFQVITEDMQERFPEDCEIVGSGHWGVGWTEQLAVRVFKDKPEDGRFWPREEDITDAFKALLEWDKDLSDYPVANDEHHSKLEHEEMVEYLGDNSLECEINGIEFVIARSDEAGEELASLCYEKFQASRPDDLPAWDEIRGAAIEAKILVPDHESVKDAMKELEQDAETLRYAIADHERGLIDSRELLRIAEKGNVNA